MKPMQTLLSVTLLLASLFAPAAQAGPVRDTPELRLLEAAIASAGEDSEKSRQLVLETALSDYLKFEELSSSEQRARDFREAAEALGLHPGSIELVGEVFSDAAMSRKGQAGAQVLLAEPTLKRNLSEAFARIRFPEGAKFDSRDRRCSAHLNLMTAGLVVGLISAIELLGEVPAEPCLEWRDDSGFIQNCGWGWSDRYSCQWQYYQGTCTRWGEITPAERSRVRSTRRALTAVSGVGFIAAFWGIHRLGKDGCERPWPFDKR